MIDEKVVLKNRSLDEELDELYSLTQNHEAKIETETQIIEDHKVEIGSFVIDDNALNNKDISEEFDTLEQEPDLELDARHLLDEVWKNILMKKAKKNIKGE